MNVDDQLIPTASDDKHGPFEGTRLGRSRLALACIDDELAEALEAWRAERKAPRWIASRTEVLQVAAVAMRAVRDAFADGPAAERARSNHIASGLAAPEDDETFACPRCGSTSHGGDIDYSGCNDCREGGQP